MSKIAPVLTGSAKTVFDLVTNFGSITYAQTKALCGSEEKASRILSMLERNRMVKVSDDKCFVNSFTSKAAADSSVYDCLWIALNKSMKKVDDKPVFDLDSLSSSFGTGGAVCMTYLNNNICYNIAYITESNAAATANYIIAEAKARGAAGMEGLQYVFVTRDLAAAAIIRDMTLNFPHKIAYLTGDVIGIPNIKYIKAK